LSLVEHPEGEFSRRRQMRAPGSKPSDFEGIDQTSRLVIQAPVADAPLSPSTPTPVADKHEEGLWSPLLPASPPGSASAPAKDPVLARARETEHGFAPGASSHLSRAAGRGAMALAGAVATVVIAVVLFAGFLNPGAARPARAPLAQRSAAAGSATTAHKSVEAIKRSGKSPAVPKRAATPGRRRREGAHTRMDRRSSTRRFSRMTKTSVAHGTAVPAAPTTSAGSSTPSYTRVSNSSPAQSSTPPVQQTLTHTQSGPTGLGYEVGTGCDPTCH
jgi:hypothetical protein